MKNRYTCLDKNIFTIDGYSIVPIRYEDRLKIMKWRNEQMYHLRQAHPLIEEDQNRYFKEVISNLFDLDKPDQILFSYLKNNECIGYGGLVHINWIDKNAEISFIMDTKLEGNEFKPHWINFLTLIEKVAFDELILHKISTYAFDIRPNLYPIFENLNFTLEATLIEHILFNTEYIDVIIHSKINK